MRNIQYWPTPSIRFATLRNNLRSRHKLQISDQHTIQFELIMSARLLITIFKIYNNAPNMLLHLKRNIAVHVKVYLPYKGTKWFSVFQRFKQYFQPKSVVIWNLQLLVGIFSSQAYIIRCYSLTSLQVIFFKKKRFPAKVPTKLAEFWPLDTYWSFIRMRFNILGQYNKNYEWPKVRKFL